MQKVFIGSDHAGLEAKSLLIEFLKLNFANITVEDCGTNSSERTDYTVYAQTVAQNVVKYSGIGILICGSGVGVSIAANKQKGIRAALLYSKQVARLARQHNDANIICFGARMFSIAEISEMTSEFLNAQFEGGIHLQRVKNIES